jgi:hypothetical protein
MIYVCLDSCIFDRIVTQGKPGCTTECFEELKKLAHDGKIRIIVPEVVVLEFEKFCRELENAFAASIEQFKKDVAEACARKQKLWNEIDDLKQSLGPHIEAAAAKKKAAFPDRIKAVSDLLQSEVVTRVPYDLGIMLKAKRRLMSGRMPPSEKKADQDASIIESMLTVLPKGEELYFCSENIKDFALEIPNKGFALHPILAEDLPKSKFFADLCSLVEAIETGKTTPEPTVEEIKAAVQEVAATEHSIGFTLSPNARMLLTEAANDSWGQLSCTTTNRGLSVRANGREFVERGNTESEVQWYRAVRELFDCDLLEVLGSDPMDTAHEAFMVTPKGFQTAYKLMGRLPNRWLRDQVGNENRVMEIIAACARVGVPSAVRERLRGELLKTDLGAANRYLVARPDGWFLFADDARPFQAHGEYYVVDLLG